MMAEGNKCMFAKKKLAVTGAAWLAGIGLVMGTQHEIPPAFGPFLHPSKKDFADAKTFTSAQRMVGTYYFYWYDDASKAHIINGGKGTDALTDHPPTLDGFSWKSVAWHKKQLADMEDAGIDVALMVFWGAPSEHQPGSAHYWSFEGLKPLVQARAELLRERRHPPAIGLFYDTSTLANNSWGEQVDLTTDYGRKWFYATVRDFFSCIPARDWAMIDNKPIVLLYSADFARNYDQSFIDYARTAFAADFSGRGLYIAPQNSWRVKGDSECAWGGALGLKRAGIGELGPGYDHSAVPGRKPLVVKRENGKFYEDNWFKFMRHPSNFVMIETWNEFHEGTDICESREYGRKYIELTREYTRLFKQGVKPPLPYGEYKDFPRVSIVLGGQNHGNGLRLLECDDGMTAPVVAQGSAAIKLAAPQSRYMYFAADDSFKWSDSMHVKLVVEYFDTGEGSLGVEFDGSDPGAPFKGAYTWGGKSVAMTGVKQWKTAEFDLTGARFLNSENSQADFRLDIRDPDLCVRRVTLVRE
jgi:hypothetical protein